jgi:hypothetical protein
LTIFAIAIIFALSSYIERLKFCSFAIVNYSRVKILRTLFRANVEILRGDQLKFWKKKFELSYFKLIFVLEQIYFFNISLPATSRCLQHLVVCNISLPATSRCLQHLVACNTSLSATPRCLQHLVACNTSLPATPRCCNQSTSARFILPTY